MIRNKIDVKLSHKTYPIYIEKGLLNSIGKEISKIFSGKNIAVVTDENVNRYYGDKVTGSLEAEGFYVKKIVLKAGEASKSFETLTYVYDELLDIPITRGDLIIALGGGVIGDLTGFAASTILRGVPFVQIPTSLLAEVDSSIGGKVAVDVAKGKNLVGSFYHPEAVFIDIEVLNTLDKKYLHDGLAEVIKYGAIKDSKLFEALLNFKDDDELIQNIGDIIYTCCDIKREIVEKDEKEKGDRMLLNFGHTIGHAIEKYYNFEKYSHGEAVAIGMYTITLKSEQLGITEKGSSEKLKELLIKYELPYEISGIPKERLLEAIALDKKNNRDRMNIILIKKIGDSFINNIPNTEMKDYI